MTLLVRTLHPPDKLKTINAAPVIMVHRLCRHEVTGLVALDAACTFIRAVPLFHPGAVDVHIVSWARAHLDELLFHTNLETFNLLVYHFFVTQVV